MYATNHVAGHAALRSMLDTAGWRMRTATCVEKQAPLLRMRATERTLRCELTRREGEKIVLQYEWAECPQYGCKYGNLQI